MRAQALRRRPWLLMSAACLVPAVLDSLQIWLKGRMGGDGVVYWGRVLWQGGEWLILGALIPITWVLGQRFPLRQPHLARHLLYHVGGALALCVGWAVIGMALGALLGSTPETLAGWLLTSLPWSVFMYFTTLGCVHAVTYFVEARERESHAARLAAQLAEARLAALRMQFNPHFLFNSLNALLVLVRDQDTARAERMLEQLSDVLRQVLRADRDEEVSLDDEVRFLRDYLGVEQMRFSDRLQIQLSVAPRASVALVPRFILQPLVENALRHGIARLERPGTIEIDGQLEGDVLVLTVGDDGPGMPDVVVEGVGLRNVRERLHTLFGDRASLRFVPRPAGGTYARIRLPYRSSPGADEATTPIGARLVP